MRSIFSSILCFLLPLGTSYGSDSCESGLYGGFDSRVARSLVGRLPASTEAVVGFEIANGNAVIAFPHRLLGIDREQVYVVPSIDEIRGLSVGRRGGIYVRTSRQVKRIGAAQLVPDSRLPSHSESILFGSGAQVLAEAKEHDGRTDFYFLREDGQELPFTSVSGKLRAASWTPAGFAAVVDTRLLVWNPGNKKMIQLADEPGLAKARDICIVAPDQVVLALSNVVLLVSPTSRTILVNMTARCRFVNGKLYLLDERFGPIWAVEGVERLGGKTDREYALQLLKTLPPGTPETAPAFREAARILGCVNARRLRSAGR